MYQKMISNDKKQPVFLCIKIKKNYDANKMMNNVNNIKQK